jgi:hypothetical protein
MTTATPTLPTSVSRNIADSARRGFRDLRVHARTALGVARLTSAQAAEVDGIEARIEARKANPPAVPVTAEANRTRIALKREALTRAAVIAAAESCGYRRSGSRWAGGDHRVEVTFTPAYATRLLFGYASGSSERAWSANGKWSGSNSVHKFQVRPNWRTRVAAQGLAVVDGMLTLDAIVVEPGIWKATWVVQAAGFALREVVGFLARHPDGRIQHAASEAAARLMVAGVERKARNADTAMKEIAIKERATALLADMGSDLDGWANRFGEVKVTKADSHRAGNCQTGTRDWSAKHLGDVSSAKIVEIIHALRQTSDRTGLALRACAYAVARVQLAKATKAAAKAA